MLAGDIDAMVPYDNNAAPVVDRVNGAELVTLTAASHTGFSGRAGPLRWLNNPDSLGCYWVKSDIDESAAEPWFELIGSEAQGIDYSAVNEFCVMDPLPQAMNVLRQQMISLVVVSSFFESQFAPDAATRESAKQYLSETMSRELSDVSYRSAVPG